MPNKGDLIQIFGVAPTGVGGALEIVVRTMVVKENHYRCANYSDRLPWLGDGQKVSLRHEDADLTPQAAIERYKRKMESNIYDLSRDLTHTRERLEEAKLL